ncbi:unnamed protein product [Strongylus vulgaris]|uniref:Uncharacterized protein n=1 Tax=Strongylus vulgaris TaxID=40348 RepID=A0A3P7ITW3_STRVU|nr:unnamed protein product [Strongylus vulgaris]
MKAFYCLFAVLFFIAQRSFAHLHTECEDEHSVEDEDPHVDHVDHVDVHPVHEVVPTPYHIAPVVAPIPVAHVAPAPYHHHHVAVSLMVIPTIPTTTRVLNSGMWQNLITKSQDIPRKQLWCLKQDTILLLTITTLLSTFLM